MPQVAQGGTVRLLATFEDATGALTDPVGPAVDILDPSNVTVVNDAPLVRDSLGEYHYDFTAAPTAPLGAWIGRFTGVVNGAPITGDEPFTVLPPGSVGVGQPWLVQLSDVKTALNIDPTDTRKDDLYTALIGAASAEIINYTGRDFASPLVTETRSFEYDGCGYLDVDDCTTVTQVALAVPHGDDYIVDPDLWTAMPFPRRDVPVQYYITLPPGNPYGLNVAMGFGQNLDVYAADHGLPVKPQTAKVTATWGWPVVPENVKLAAIWTVRDWGSNPKGGEALTAEAIAGYSRSWGRMAGGGMLALPNAAKDILATYQRLQA